MNLKYPEFPMFNEFVLVLQMSGAAGILLGQYGSMLDIKTESGLARMFYSTIVICFILISWRLIYFGWLSYKILKFFYQQEDYPFFIVAVVVLSAMTLLSLAFTDDGIRRFNKFSKLYFSNSGIN